MNVLAAVIPQIKAYVVRGSETGDVSRDDVNRDRFPREGCPKQSVLTETEDIYLLMKMLEKKKKTCETTTTSQFKEQLPRVL